MTNYIKNPKAEALFRSAKKEIEKNGWVVTEDLGENNEMLLICEKEGRRKGWGMFHPITCWSEAYKTICGKDILTLLD